ncbi:gastrula zinc finger protein XlCGF26.1-like isoform X2 [Sitophilus oryzae]|uniref:Gastrula zinc finger protein XlCGF26.1-like isoform X2 n=1 Tax=Sitophilus oryzae TaxID=7048 RepID=A0A6J2XI28_SITOR|nr:gastrula zinc finger protein XlCGF26.1-like isoform X2 [Sitophilus oryzae]
MKKLLCCIFHSKKRINFYKTTRNGDSRFLSMVNYLFQLQIHLDDKMPSTVCQECYQIVERTWQFKEQVDKSQLILSDLVAVETISNNIIPNPPNDVVFEEDCKTSQCFELVDNQLVEETAPLEFQNLEQTEQIQIVQIKKNSKPSKKGKQINKKSKATESGNLKEIEYINPDGSVIPKSGISGWDSYQWSCFDCNSTFQLTDELREHFNNVHNSNIRYPCMDCSKVYSKYTTFISHVRFHRPHLKYSCDICYKWYGTAKEVDQHRSSHFEERPYHCNTCGKRFRIQSNLTSHTRSHLPEELKNVYYCDLCPKKFGTKPNLMAHKRIHLGIKDYTCDHCGKSFVLKGNLDNHILTHNSARPYKCTVCDKTFKSLLRLRKHNSVHSGLKPHRCDICGKEFRERGTLKEHHRIHTGAMPFTCEFCGKCFRFKGVLTTHRRQHTGERPYSCNECQHHFTNWPNYNKHMKRRHGINTSVTCRTRQDIPPTGKPHRNPPGTVLAPPQASVVNEPSVLPLETYEAQTTTFYPVVGIYGIPEEMLQHRV